MAQAKKKTATRSTKRVASQCRQSGRKGCGQSRKEQEQSHNMFFVVSMSILAATLLFADILMMTA